MAIEPQQPHQPTQVNYLILVLTTRCNLRCSYCYHGDPKELLDMEPVTLKQAFARAASGTGPLHIQLTGGEPGLVPDLIEQAGGLAQTLTRPWTMGLQTNGTFINGRIVDLVRRFNLQVGVSLDGSPQTHESLRGMAAETLRGLMLLEAEQIPFRVTTVVGNGNADRLDRLAWMLAGFSQARGIGLDLLVMKGKAAQGDGAPLPAEPGQLVRGIEALVASLVSINRQRKIPLRLREWDLVRRLLSGAEQPVRTFCQAGAAASLAVRPDGRCFPCGQTLGDLRFEEDITIESGCPVLPTVSLAASRRDCSGCPLEHRCPNECPSRLLYNDPKTHQLACTLYQTLARACLREEKAAEWLRAMGTDPFVRREGCRP